MSDELTPLISFDDTLLGLWYVQISMDSDLLGGLSRLSDGRLRYAYRFRYYRDDKTHNSADEKNSYTGTIEKAPGVAVLDVARALDTFRLMFQTVRAESGGQFFECLRADRSTEAMLEEFERWPCAHPEPE